jgi:DNA segregation ATPase FtsK/SpoIIIE, S-DNA-T family
MKKLFTKEDEYIDEIEYPSPTLKDERDEEKLDRVHIQGKFRFPVIPDYPSIVQQHTYEEETEPTLKRKSVPRRQEVEKKSIVEQSPPRHHKPEKNLIVEQPVRGGVEPELPKQKNVKKRPFRPTEIPSPIYGFNRPVPSQVVAKQEPMHVTDQKEEQVFYPEEGISKAAPHEHEYHSAVQQEYSMNVEREEPIQINDEYREEQEVHIPSLEEQRDAEYIEEIHFNREETFIESEVVQEEAVFFQKELEKGQEEAVSFQKKLEEEQEEAVSFQKKLEEEQEEAVSFQEKLEEEQEEIVSFKEKLEEEREEVVSFQEELEGRQERIDIATESHTAITKDAIEQPEKTTYTEQQQQQQQNHVAKEHTSYPEQPVKKRVVPYNVMMLKEDRVKQEKKVEQQLPTYQFPSLSLLNIPAHSQENDEEWIKEQAELLHTALQNFNVGAKVVHYTQGPAVTRFEVQPDPGVKVNKITNLTDDIKLNLAAKDIRIEAPIPGKNTVGIEVPNRTSKPVMLREILRTPAFTKDESPVPVALGLDISGKPIVTDVKKMPHGLIAGATGSGKSVCINAILLSILYKAQPHEVKLMLIDPKMVELAPYNHIPHLVSPVITDVKAATAALKWAVEEMERRYELFAHAGVRDLTRFNELAKKHGGQGEPLPYLVIVIDELADLMMVAPGDVEESICRIAQKARACGIHLLLATQRPSVDVITGLIKANIPTRLAFTVSSQIDSRTIIDTNGADKLLGRGDMLFLENGSSKPVRVQGVYVSDEEIERVVSHVKQQMQPNYLFQQEDLVMKATNNDADDDLFYEACEFIIEQGGASASSLQRKFRIGYNRAARLVDMMEAQGIISEARGSKPREVLITENDLTDMNV